MSEKVANNAWMVCLGRIAVAAAACMMFLGLHPGSGRLLAHVGDGEKDQAISEAQITQITPPEQDFFSKRLDYHGLPIKGHAVVADEAFYEAGRRIHRLLGKNPQILRNLLAGGLEVHLLGRNQAQTDLPDFPQSHGASPGDPLSIAADKRSSEMAGSRVICGEEGLLGLSRDGHRDRHPFWREMTRAVYLNGISANARRRIEQTHEASREAGLWKGTDARSNAHEYLAALALAYVDGEGDWDRSLSREKPGPDWLKKYDPSGYRLVDDLFEGRWDVESGSHPGALSVPEHSPAAAPSGPIAAGNAPADHGHGAMATARGKSVTVGPGEVLEIKTTGVELSYDITEIRAQAGAILTIRYNNAESDMAHNIVLVRTERDIMPVGVAALRAHRNEYIPQDEMDRIIAFSKLAYPGDTIEFPLVVPPPGIYPYICTYSGHFTMMQGRLISIEPEASATGQP